MKQTLQLKLSQHLTLTPQLQQSIRLLQLSTMELNQELEKFLAENPLLEREDTESEIPAPPVQMNGEQAPALQAPAEDASTETPSQTDIFSADTDWGGESGPSPGARDDTDEGDFFQVPAESPNLREYLHRQLTLTKLEPRDRNLVAFLIEALDEGGYLTQPMEELAQLVPEELQIEPEELDIALKHLQNFDPTGVGARNCAECLGGEPQPRRAAEAAHQSHVCRYPAEQPESVGQPALASAAGGTLADQERAAAIRDDPARVAGDRRPSAPFFRARRSRDAAAGAARNRKHARPARIDRFARYDSEVHVHAARYFRAQVLLRKSRRHRDGGRLLGHRHPGVAQAAGCRRGWPKTSFGQQDLRDPQPAGHRGRTSHHRQVPGAAADSFGEHEKVSLTRRHASHESHDQRAPHGGHAVDPQLRRGQTFQDPAAF